MKGDGQYGYYDIRIMQGVGFEGKIQGLLYGSGVGGTILDNKSINDNTWHHIVLLRTNAGTKLELYLDSLLINNVTVSVMDLQRADPLIIGTEWNFGAPNGAYKGNIYYK